MPLKRKKMSQPDVDVSSFSDIAFLLIIFFILTTTFARPIGRLVSMPAATDPEEEKKQTEDRTPMVSISMEKIIVGELDGDEDGKELTLSELRINLINRSLHDLPAEKRIVAVEMSPDTTYQRYYEIITMIAECGGLIAVVDAEEAK